MSDVVINKTEIIERCINRIKEEYEGNPMNLKNYTKQDSILLNIQRACEACIDLAMHVVAEKSFGIPQNSRDAFELLRKNGVIDDALEKKLKSMVGFRNIAVHNYQLIDLKVVQDLIENGLNDLIVFSRIILQKYNN
ncbi:type VII toxin-antitoxin system HepT family RNase toxin [Thermoanaerobacterium thermosaccharolyticum]|jgi:uncharacterized protein YutE (UPF0331/DUF86 family)|uniref:type VII toxin-antitoxin system HepT family RNase toxin n=1 Tax=Thermoanaerobacterium thermosaccharolyticum TaxID=1517 RepID=UPI001239FACC|nr:DUF86 domain-containing protein [Thermoanaerobacterium thermosaccharolyticum]KAA5807435.1 DUF86 domain-containing protein [Thermoanaerobacterium thermosaccharolyticum]